MSKLSVACLQMTAGLEWSDHAEEVARLIRLAATAGAQFIATPENTGGMVKDREGLRDHAPLMDTHPTVLAFADLARETGAWLLCGSLALRPSEDAKKPVNRSILFAPDGNIAAYYDKIHLFDVDLETGESYRESALFDAGDKAVLADMDGVKLGLTICYDLRFPTLFRTLAQAGAQLIAVPSAFTVPTGEAHWEILLRARAIETGAFILAPAQVGTHANGRCTWGHSLIIDPWGRVLSDAGDKPGVAMAMIELNRVKDVRQSLPQLQHDQPFTLAFSTEA